MSNKNKKKNIRSSKKMLLVENVKKPFIGLWAVLSSTWAKIDWRDPSWQFLAALIVLGFLLIHLMLPKSFLIAKGTLMRATVEEQKEKLRHLDQAPDTKKTETFFIDTIDFPDGSTLEHAKLGPFFYTVDFFMHIQGEFEALAAGEYTFIVSSDDGFRLAIDGKMVSEFTNDRPMSETEGKFSLTKGIHSFAIKYYQGYGQLGLQAWYTAPGNSTRTMMGVNSSFLRFIRWEKTRIKDTPAVTKTPLEKLTNASDKAGANKQSPGK
jgi:hypothetical protein